MDGFRPREDAEEAEQERDHSARARPDASVGGDGSGEHCEWHEAADQVVGGRRARVRLDEAVVEDVHCDDAGCGGEGDGCTACGGESRTTPVEVKGWASAEWLIGSSQLVSARVERG